MSIQPTKAALLLCDAVRVAIAPAGNLDFTQHRHGTRRSTFKFAYIKIGPHCAPA